MCHGMFSSAVSTIRCARMHMRLKPSVLTSVTWAHGHAHCVLRVEAAAAVGSRYLRREEAWPTSPLPRSP